MKFCHKCGNSLSDNANFCPGCGTRVLSGTQDSNAGHSSEYIPDYAPAALQKKSKTKAVLISVIGVFAVIICVLTVLIVINIQPSDKDSSEETTARGHNTVSESDERTTARAETTTREPLTASTEKLPEVTPTKPYTEVPTNIYATEKGENTYMVCSDPDWNYDIATLNLYDDFTFSMTVNLYEGWGHITGTYAYRTEGSIICYVTYKDFSGFTGDDLSEFSIVNANGYNYVHLHGMQYVGALETGSAFTIAG